MIQDMCTRHITRGEHVCGHSIGRIHESYKYFSINKMATCFPKAIIICSVQKLENVWILDYMCTIAKVHLQSVE
jgi:hypothetical protein